MATAIRYEGSNGTKRQCTARCHDAKSPKCTCVCGGVLHGSVRDKTFGQKLQEYSDNLVAGRTVLPVQLVMREKDNA